MANGNGFDLNSLIKEWQTGQKYQDLTWSGSFSDYLNLIKANPKVTRNAFQRMYDMVIEKGKTDYTEFKKPIVRYKFFDDAENDGRDAGFDRQHSDTALKNE
jgi:serine protein kinase